MPTYDTYFYIFEDSWQSANRRTLENKCDGIDSQSVSPPVCQSLVIFACLHLIIEIHAAAVAVAVACHAHTSGRRPQPLRQNPAHFRLSALEQLLRYLHLLEVILRRFASFFSSNIISTLCAGFENNKRRAAKSIWLIQMTGWIFHYSIVFTVQ